MRWRFMNARPDPVFKYFSKLNAVYLSAKLNTAMVETGSLLRV